MNNLCYQSQAITSNQYHTGTQGRIEYSIKQAGPGSKQLAEADHDFETSS